MNIPRFQKLVSR